MSPYPRPGEKVEEKKRTPRDGVEYVPSSLLPSSYSHNPDHPFPNDLLHFPHATTDIHAHVMVCDLINDEKSIATIADDWHLTFAQTDHIASLPIVDREVEALKKLVKLRAELMSLVYGDRAIRSLARVAAMPLLDPDSRGYTEQAANTRASLVRLASTALLSDARRRAAPVRAVSTRTASVSERTSSHNDAALENGDGASTASTALRTASVSERTSASELTPPSPAACPTGALHDLPPALSLRDDADSSRVECLGEDQAWAGVPACSQSERAPSDLGVRVPLVPAEPARGEAEPVRSVPGDSPSPSPSVVLRDLRGEPSSRRPSDSSAVFSSVTDRATEPSDATNPPGRTEAPAIHSPSEALRAAAGSTHNLRNPSRRARDHPAA